MPGELFTDFVFGYLNRFDECVSIPAIRLQDSNGYCETIFRLERAVLKPGERLVVTPKQALDMRMGIFGVDYKHKYHSMDKAF